MDAPKYEQSASDPPGEYRDGLLKAFIEKIKQEVGDNSELVKQAVADLNAQQRQDAQNHFDSRQEYIRQIFEVKAATLASIKEYGLQTLKWLFLLNAGAIAVILAYVGGALGKPASGMSGVALVPVFKALWPFVAGCTLVVAAGASGFFNFSYGEATLPSAEELHNFSNLASKTWPQPRFKEFGKRINATRTIAIVCAFASVFCFGYGVFRVLHAALRQIS